MAVRQDAAVETPYVVLNVQLVAEALDIIGNTIHPEFVSLMEPCGSLVSC